VIAEGMRGKDVFPLEIQPREPLALLGPDKLRPRLLAECNIKLEVPLACRV